MRAGNEEGEYVEQDPIPDVYPLDYIVAVKDQFDVESEIKINIGYGVTNYKIYLRATTLGGQIAIKEIDITI